MTAQPFAPIAYRGTIIDFQDEPAKNPNALRHYADGLMVVDRGRVVQVGDAATLMPTLAKNINVVDYSGYWLMPGFIDTHIHYAQMEVMASFGTQLIDWLNRYTFPAEMRQADPQVARQTARMFWQELNRHGTTTAMIFGTVHEDSANALFETAGKRRIIAGKVLMDRHAPPDLCDSADLALTQCQRLIKQWHGKERFAYALTPRFAPTSSEAQLEVVSALLRAHPSVYLQTHVAENLEEVRWVAKLFPWSKSYLDVYDHYAMLTRRSVFAHCLHLSANDRQRMAETGAVMSFCPTSNLFLGSGLFDYQSAQNSGVRIGIATDIGGGTHFSLLQTLAEAYKILQLRAQTLTPEQGFYWATLGGARALSLEAYLGNFNVDKEADFVVINPRATPLMARRMAIADSLQEQMFALMMLGDDRAIAATYILGEAVYTAFPDRDRQEATQC